MATRVFRGGSRTNDSFTPRLKDLEAAPGSAPGLSVYAKLEDAVPKPGGKAQTVDLDLLGSPLQAIPDNVAEGGIEGHYVIAPVAPGGSIDLERLKEWAEWRGRDQPHPLTQLVLDAIVDPDIRRPK